MLLMWKPFRLQVVGAAYVVVDIQTQPAGKLLHPLRIRWNCLFGLALTRFTPGQRTTRSLHRACTFLIGYV